jgi:uncharacterized protein (TIGR00251 family)
VSAWSVESDGVRLAVRVQPGAKAARIDGVANAADGGEVLKIRVTAPPAAGKANAALVAFLAKTLKLPKSAVTIISGHGAKLKTVHLAGAPADLAHRLRGSARPIDGS